MSTYKKDTHISGLEVPAFSYYSRDPRSDDKGINLTDDELVMIGGDIFYVFTVVGYALRNNEDPIAAYNRAVELGHTTVGLSKKATCVSGPGPKVKIIALDMMDTIHIQGHSYTMSPDWNQNIKLTKVDS